MTIIISGGDVSVVVKEEVVDAEYERDERAQAQIPDAAPESGLEDQQDEEAEELVVAPEALAPNEPVEHAGLYVMWK